jgi:sugar lactone lactonase YvrE
VYNPFEDGLIGSGKRSFVGALAPLLIYAQGVMTTVAGSTWAFPASANGGLAIDAPLLALSGIALDSNGNIFAADNGNNLIVKISRSGILTIVAGTGTAGFSGDSGPATQANLSAGGVAVDAGGNLYLADTINNRIRKVTPDGTISTVAETEATLFTERMAMGG